MKYIVVGMIWAFSAVAVEFDEYHIANVDTEVFDFANIDMDADGVNEIVFLDESRTQLMSYRIDADYSVETTVLQDFDCTITTFTVHDSNQDGFDDLTLLCVDVDDENLFNIWQLQNLAGTGFNLTQTGSFNLPRFNWFNSILALKDIDDDGDLDITISKNVYVGWLENQNNTYVEKLVGGWPVTLAAQAQEGDFTDLDADGDLDSIASIAICLSFGCTQDDTKLYYFDETMNEYVAGIVLSDETYDAIETADINGDGTLEIIANPRVYSQRPLQLIDYQSLPVQITELEIEIDGKFSLIDVDNDSLVDIFDQEASIIYLNQGDYNFTTSTIDGDVKLLADLNGDGLLDAIVEKFDTTLNSNVAVLLIQVDSNEVMFSVNEGLNGNWYNLATPGQGIFLDVKPDLEYAYMGWFTFDTTLPVDDEAGQIGAAGHRWLVGNGEINQSTHSIDFELFYAAGGLFDNDHPVNLPAANPYGTMTIVFNTDCGHAEVRYAIPTMNLVGNYAIIRPSAGSLGLCSAFAQGNFIPAEGVFDVSLNGHWYNPDTQGQGIFIEQFAERTTAFIGWFTFDTAVVENPVMSQVGEDGQRWLVGPGEVNQDNSNVLDFELLYSAGGLFDDPTDTTVEGIGDDATLSIEFINCANAQVSYDIPAENISGTYAMVKLLTDANQSCPDAQ